jgi:nucleoside-diphosphate-sugar epimerase
MLVMAEQERPGTALVAGGTGVLGSAVVALLLGRGDSVCVPWIVEAEAEALASRHAAAIDDGRLRLSQCNAADADHVA